MSSGLLGLVVLIAHAVLASGPTHAAGGRAGWQAVGAAGDLPALTFVERAPARALCAATRTGPTPGACAISLLPVLLPPAEVGDAAFVAARGCAPRAPAHGGPSARGPPPPR